MQPDHEPYGPLADSHWQHFELGYDQCAALVHEALRSWPRADPIGAYVVPSRTTAGRQVWGMSTWSESLPPQWLSGAALSPSHGCLWLYLGPMAHGVDDVIPGCLVGKSQLAFRGCSDPRQYGC